MTKCRVLHIMKEFLPLARWSVLLQCSEICIMLIVGWCVSVIAHPLEICIMLIVSWCVCIGDKLFRYGDFFSEKIIVGPQEAQYPQFLLQLPLTHYILRSIFFRTHLTPPTCLKTQECAILSTFLESGGKNHPKVRVRREKFNIGNCPQIFFMTSYICWELTTKFS